MTMSGKKVVVLGYGVSGRSAARFLLAKGADVVVVDDHADKEGVLSSYDDPFDLLVPSPGISPHHPLYQKAIQTGIPIMGEAELALQQINQTVLGVTGTNGKTTVTELTAHVLNQCGVPAVALGNNGRPLTEWVLEGDDRVVVAELSSYQLETMRSPTLDRAVILNISPDHLDRYHSLEAYAEAKFCIAKACKPPVKLLTHPKLLCEGCTSYISEALGVPESFEDENRYAAYSLVQPFGITPTQFIEAARSFSKPPHRMEFIDEVNGVRYYNDSKGTNIDAVIKAVEALPGKIYLIAGGKDKGEKYTPWISTFSGKIGSIGLIGEAAEKIERDLAGSLPIKHCATLDQAFAHCKQLAQPGDVVLLSPGCASFDQYRCFEERGEEFRQLVNNLSIN